MTAASQVRCASPLRRALPATVVLLTLALTALAVASASAQAASSYVFSTSFDRGQSTGFLHGNGVVVDNSTSPSDPSAGDIYIANGNTVNKFSPASAAAGNDSPDAQLTGFAGSWGVAVDPANGDLYVTELQGGVRKFDASGAPIGSFSVDPAVPISFAAGIAVNPSNGHVYIGSFISSTIYEFTSSGTYTGNSFTGPGGVQGMAVDSSGAVYAATGSGGAVKFTAPGSAYQTVDAGPSYGVSVDPSNNNVFVGDGTHVTQYSSSGTQIGNPFGQGNLHSTRGGIGVDSGANNVYVADISNDSANVFLNSALLPDVATGSMSNLYGGNVTISGTAAPAPSGGGEVTGCHFEYGLSIAYGQSIPCLETVPFSAESAVSATVANLKFETTYHYRLDASNAKGTNVGADETFTTGVPDLPVIEETTSSDVTETSAIMRSQINPSGAPTIFYYEWGRGPSYEFQTLSGDSIGSDSSSHSAGTSLSGLAPATSYHFRVVATNFSGNAYGPDQVLTTIGPTAERAAAGSNGPSTATPPPGPSPALPCKKHFVRKRGKCVKKKPAKRRTHSGDRNNGHKGKGGKVAHGKGNNQ